MKKDNEFIKTKLDVYNVDEHTESDSVSDTLRDKYPALSARFAESRKAKNAEKPTKKKPTSNRRAAFIGVAVACAAVAAVVLPATLIDPNDDKARGPATTTRLSVHEITFDHLAENYDVLLPADTDGIVCYEYKYRASNETAYIEYKVQAFTVDVIIDGDYQYENHKFGGLNADGSTELFEYKYKIEHSYSAAVFDYADRKYYVVSDTPQTAAPSLSDLLDSLKPAAGGQ